MTKTQAIAATETGLVQLRGALAKLGESGNKDRTMHETLSRKLVQAQAVLAAFVGADDSATPAQLNKLAQDAARIAAASR